MVRSGVFIYIYVCVLKQSTILQLIVLAIDRQIKIEIEGE